MKQANEGAGACVPGFSRWVLPLCWNEVCGITPKINVTLNLLPNLTNPPDLPNISIMLGSPDVNKILMW